MLYIIIRLAIFILFFVLTLKIMNGSKRKLGIMIIIICIFFLIGSFFVPLENLLINFKTPETVFEYACIGEIKDVIYGNESCMVYYETGKNAYSYSFFKKVNGSFKIINAFQTKKIFHKLDTNGIFDIYNVTGTSDYYVFGTVNSQVDAIEIYNNKNEIVECDVKRNNNTSFIYFVLKDFRNGYYLIAGEEKIFLS